MKTKLIEKQKELIDWLEIRLNDLDSFDKYNQIKSEIAAFESSQEPGKSAEDYSESDYRERIVDELSTQELRDRLCETKTELESIRAEWLKLLLNNIGKKEQPITDEEIEKEFPIDRETILKDNYSSDLFTVQRNNKLQQDAAKWARDKK